MISSSESDEPNPAPKRVKTTEALQIKQISEIQDLSGISQKRGCKEKRRKTSESMSPIWDMGICYISVLNDRRHVLEIELHSSNKKEKQSKWYKTAKSRSTVEGLYLLEQFLLR